MLDVPSMTEFMLTENVKLGLMSEHRIAKILAGKTPHPSSGNGIPRCELYIHVENLETAFALALRAGAKEISPVQERDWGDTGGYLSDFDEHIIAITVKTLLPPTLPHPKISISSEKADNGDLHTIAANRMNDFKKKKKILVNFSVA